MAEISEQMKVVGKDGVHIGTVDRVEASRLELFDSSGRRHCIERPLVGAVEGNIVKLAVNADAAVD